jgi:hypothetical protein
LNEGLAMYAEGDLDAASQSQLDAAISNDTLIALRSLNGSFSEMSDKANLSYSQSQSVVKFLIETYGQEKMTQLLAALRDAKTIDDALVEVYGFDTDGLEDAWRKAVNAAPRAASAQPTAMPTPTFVPTYVPITGSSFSVTPTPYVIPTSSFDGSNNNNQQTYPEDSGGQPSDTNLLIVAGLLACACVFTLIVIGLIIVGLVVRKNKGGGNA